MLDVLSSAQKSGRRFRVIVVDSRPRLDGRDMLLQLLDAGVSCSYGVITAISHHMKEVRRRSPRTAASAALKTDSELHVLGGGKGVLL